MSKKFCGQCGTELNPNARFCPHCGISSETQTNETLEKKTEDARNPSSQRQEESLPEKSAVIDSVNKDIFIEKHPAVNGIVHKEVNQTAPPADNAADRIVNVPGQPAGASTIQTENTYLAAAGGLMVFTHNKKTVANDATPSAVSGPVKYFFNGFGRIFKGFPAVFKDKKRLIFAGVLAVIWLALTLLPAFGVNAPAIRWFGFLTFAQGGLNGGVLGLVGGVIGKGVFAFFLSSLLMPLFGGGKPMSGLGNGFKIFFSSFAIKDLHALSFLLLGAGLALAVYNFMTGNTSIQNGMAGIAAFFVSVRALSSKAGFLRGFLLSMSKKTRGGRATQPVFVNRVIAGWAVGFLLGVALSNTGVSIIGYITGLVLVVAAVVIKIAAGNKKAVTG